MLFLELPERTWDEPFYVWQLLNCNQGKVGRQAAGTYLSDLFRDFINMSTTTLRYQAITLSFLPYKRERRISKGLRILRIRASRRRARCILRNLLARRN